MPAYLTSLIVILVVILGGHAVMARLFEDALDREALVRMRNGWALLTPMAFMAPTPWLYFGGLIVLSQVMARSIPGPRMAQGQIGRAHV